MRAIIKGDRWHRMMTPELAFIGEGGDEAIRDMLWHAPGNQWKEIKGGAHGKPLAMSCGPEKPGLLVPTQVDHTLRDLPGLFVPGFGLCVPAKHTRNLAQIVVLHTQIGVQVGRLDRQALIKEGAIIQARGPGMQIFTQAIAIRVALPEPPVLEAYNTLIDLIEKG